MHISTQIPVCEHPTPHNTQNTQNTLTTQTTRTCTHSHAQLTRKHTQHASTQMQEFHSRAWCSLLQDVRRSRDQLAVGVAAPLAAHLLVLVWVLPGLPHVMHGRATHRRDPSSLCSSSQAMAGTAPPRSSPFSSSLRQLTLYSPWTRSRPSFPSPRTPSSPTPPTYLRCWACGHCISHWRRPSRSLCRWCYDDCCSS